VVLILSNPSQFEGESFPVLQSGKDLGKFRQLDEILYIEGYPGYQHLMSIAGNHMELVCEVKGRSLAYMLVLELKLYQVAVSRLTTSTPLQVAT
jgi:hypothetical protein